MFLSIAFMLTSDFIPIWSTTMLKGFQFTLYSLLTALWLRWKQLRFRPELKNRVVKYHSYLTKGAIQLMCKQEIILDALTRHKWETRQEFHKFIVFPTSKYTEKFICQSAVAGYCQTDCSIFVSYFLTLTSRSLKKLHKKVAKNVKRDVDIDKINYNKLFFTKWMCEVWNGKHNKISVFTTKYYFSC